MSNVLRLAIVDPSDSARDSLKTILLGLDMVWLEAECSRYEFFSDVVAQTHPDIGVVALDKDPDKALQLVEQLGQTSPNCSVLVVSVGRLYQPRAGGSSPWATTGTAPGVWRMDGHWHLSAKSGVLATPAREGRQFAIASCGLPASSAVMSHL